MGGDGSRVGVCQAVVGAWRVWGAGEAQLACSWPLSWLVLWGVEGCGLGLDGPPPPDPTLAPAPAREGPWCLIIGRPFLLMRTPPTQLPNQTPNPGNCARRSAVADGRPFFLTVATSAPHTASACEGSTGNGDGDVDEDEGDRLRRFGHKQGLIKYTDPYFSPRVIVHLIAGAKPPIVRGR